MHDFRPEIPCIGVNRILIFKIAYLRNLYTCFFSEIVKNYHFQQTSISPLVAINAGITYNTEQADYNVACAKTCTGLLEEVYKFLSEKDVAIHL